VKILTIHSSARIKNSDSRQLSNELASHLQSIHADSELIERDLTQNLSFINEAMIDAFYKPEDSLTNEEKTILANSDELTQELIDADIIIIGAPMYNFTISGCLKTYIDQICRLDKTFATNENGFEGLLTNKRCYIIATSGGTPFGSPADFLLPYIKQALKFIGIENAVEFVVDQYDADERQTAIDSVKKQIKEISE